MQLFCTFEFLIFFFECLFRLTFMKFNLFFRKAFNVPVETTFVRPFSNLPLSLV